jgi:SAM-dependent methyltransferase
VGTGPGDITPDGCAVEIYTRLPVGTEPDVIAAAVPPPASLLELGSGAGRVTHPLLRLGFQVTAVDESAAMLARIDGAEVVCSSIEDLRLGRTFDVVLLGSFLIHAGNPDVCDAIVRTCRRHVADDGVVLIQREGADWHDVLPRESVTAGGTVRVVSSTPAGPGVRSVHVEYEFPDGRWTQTFLSRPLDDAQFDGLLAKAGLAVQRYLTDSHVWVLARPVSTVDS